MFQVFYNAANVKQVDVPSFSGAFGILPKHVPTLAVLKPGVVTVYEQDGSAKKVFVSSGTVSIHLHTGRLCLLNQLSVFLGHYNTTSHIVWLSKITCTLFILAVLSPSLQPCLRLLWDHKSTSADRMLFVARLQSTKTHQCKCWQRKLTLWRVWICLRAGRCCPRLRLSSPLHPRK